MAEPAGSTGAGGRERKAMSQNTMILDGPRPSPPPIWWRWVRLLIGALLIAIFVYYVWLYSGAPERVGAVCARMEAGMSHAAVRNLAADRGLRTPDSNQGVTYLGESATQYRHGCRVEWQDGHVLRSAYETSH